MGRVNVFRYDEVDGKALDGHFDSDKADRFAEDTRWDGNNNVSVHTADKFAHQALFRTAGGRWVLNCWSQWQGSQETYEFVSDKVARDWLLVNDDDAAVEKYLGEIEDERGPGRPEVGPAVNIRFPQDVLDRLDAQSASEGIKRAELVRRLVVAGLDA